MCKRLLAEPRFREHVNKKSWERTVPTSIVNTWTKIIFRANLLDPGNVKYFFGIWTSGGIAKCSKTVPSTIQLVYDPPKTN